MERMSCLTIVNTEVTLKLFLLLNVMSKFVFFKNFRRNLTDYTSKRSKPVFTAVPTEDEYWKTVADFTKIDRQGVSFHDVKNAAAELF